MAKKKEKSQEPSPDQMATQTLKNVSFKLKREGFISAVALKSEEPGLAAAIHWGMHLGVETPRLFALALPRDAWERANANEVQKLSYEMPSPDTPEDQYPQFGFVSDGEHEAFFDLSFPPHEIDRLPGLAEINDYKRIKALFPDLDGLYNALDSLDTPEDTP